jgi:endonuclease/exonuclease/phosphatase (EEP) superfamily protein YafD
MSMLARAVATGAALLIIATTVSFVPSNEWWIRVLDFPRLQMAVALAMVLAACLVLVNRGRWRTILIAGLAFALIAQLARIVPYTRMVAPEVASADSCGGATRLRLFIANVEYANRDIRALLAMVAAIDPDVVLLTEPGAWWQAQLAPIARERPYAVHQPQEDTWGMLLYSRFPLVNPQVRFLVEPDIPSITARIRLPSGADVQFYGVHPRPPRPGDDTGDRDTELTLVAREIRQRRWPAILAGDLNDVAWSRTSRQLQRTAALRDPRVGRGLFATFNANLPAGFRWPLDHVFVTDEFALCALERLGDIGSDHFPLLVDVVLQREGSHP